MILHDDNNKIMSKGSSSDEAVAPQSINPAAGSILAFNDRPPIPDYMPKCPRGTFLSCCIHLPWFKIYDECEWWDRGHACNRYDIIMICCANIVPEGEAGGTDHRNICKDPQELIESDSSDFQKHVPEGVQNLIPEGIWKILPKLVAEFVIP